MYTTLLLFQLARADIAPPPKDTAEPRDPSASVFEEKAPTRSVAPPPERGCMASVAVAGLIMLGLGFSRRQSQQPLAV
ncbi:MAG TPA: hypothetical protein PKY30_01895 [Myxococcota bacterium]|nr:hypothetical protein [Myxococcota bacterium]HNH45755.1 hypothetical protein [Myxococcota bacterium]